MLVVTAFTPENSPTVMRQFIAIMVPRKMDFFPHEISCGENPFLQKLRVLMRFFGGLLIFQLSMEFGSPLVYTVDTK